MRLLARAKLNLALHVTGQREDGYHLLDSIVAFVELDGPGGPGDLLEVAFRAGDGAGDGASRSASGDPDRTTRLEVDGPFADRVPQGSGNLVLRAAEAVGGIASIRLTKTLPVEAGIGGGSADAAAVLRAACAHRGDPLSGATATALALGADVPVCLLGEPARMRGIGERIEPVALPSIPCVLVNPCQPISTPKVFARLSEKANAALPEPPASEDAAIWLDYLRTARNDLEPPAAELCPAISLIRTALARTNACSLARMSGSGATVFGLFPSLETANAAAAELRGSANGAWWIATGRICAASAGAVPAG